MTEENDDYVDEDFLEERRRWEGIHNDEAAQYHMLFEGGAGTEPGSSKKNWLVLVAGSLGCLGGTAVLCFGLYKLIMLLF